MIVGIIVFTLGAVFGGCVVAVNQQMVEIRTEKLMKRNRKLEEQLHIEQLVHERRKAYRDGYADGRKAHRHEAQPPSKNPSAKE